MIIISPTNISKLKSKDIIILKCECCLVHFKKLKKYVTAVLNNSKKIKLKYCSQKCQFKMQQSKQPVECKNCSVQFSKTPSQIKKTKNNFCSQSCAASWNNKHSNRTYGPKKTKFYYCKVCKVEIKYGYSYCELHKSIGSHNYCLTCDAKIKSDCKYCNDHKTIYIPICDRTIAEAEYLDARPANKYRAIRENARQIAKKFGLLKHCKICGYSKHVVTCHIKEISSFNKQTLIKKVNNVSNITGLCSNHHWEMDHNLLSKEDKEKLQPNPAT